jgi:hypothetical protein
MLNHTPCNRLQPAFAERELPLTLKSLRSLLMVPFLPS